MKRMFPERLNHTFKSEIAIVLFLFLITLVIRLIALDRIYLIARDGIDYISISRAFLSGSFLDGLSCPYPPLYPVLIAILGGKIGDMELAGKLINLILGSLTVIPIYLIGRSVYDSKVGIMGAIFFAFQPYCVRFSVDVLSDPTFLFFFVFAFYFGLKAGIEKRGNKWWSLGAGANAGLAYLTRPEGILVIVFLSGWYLLRWIFHQREKLIYILPDIVILLLTFSIFAGPYIFFIKFHTGKWQISMKPSVLKAFQLSAPKENSERRNSLALPISKRKDDESLVIAPAKPKKPFQSASVGKSIKYTSLKFIETYQFPLSLFLLIGIWGRNKKDIKRSGRILSVFLLVYLIVLCYLYYLVSYVSRRHFLPLITISLPLAGVGFWVVQKRISFWIGNLNNKWSRFLSKQITLVIVIFTVLPLTVYGLKPQGVDKVPLKKAALWIKEHAQKPVPIIMSNEPLVAYYAEGKHIYIPGISYKDFIKYVRKNRVDYLVLGEKEIKEGNLFIKKLRPDDFRKAPFENRRVLIYEVIR